MLILESRHRIIIRVVHVRPETDRQRSRFILYSGPYYLAFREKALSIRLSRRFSG